MSRTWARPATPRASSQGQRRIPSPNRDLAIHRRTVKHRKEHFRSRPRQSDKGIEQIIAALRAQGDRDGRELQSSELGVGDEIAAAASIVMGQGAEGVPVVIVRGMRFAGRDGTADELVRHPLMDLFR